MVGGEGAAQLGRGHQTSTISNWEEIFGKLEVKLEEDFHRRGQGLVEKVEEVEEPDRVAELVGVADEEQQLVGDQEDSYLLNCHQPGEILIACVKRHHCKRILLKEDKTDRIENLDCN